MPPIPPRSIIVVGAGAAGLATAIFARQQDPSLDVRLLDGAARPGAKILVSGGSRCNVTNTVVTEHDYWGGKRTVIRRVLSRLTVAETVAFFRDIGVPLKEEPGGKLFPVSNRSRDVLNALLETGRATGVELLPSTRVHDVRPQERGYTVETSRGPLAAAAVVLATGGLSLPKTGSDGGGLQIAVRLGHSVVPTTPALAPLILDTGAIHRELQGVTQDVELALRTGAPGTAGRIAARIRGSLLWTHFGVSGPAALDLSRHWLRARLQHQHTTVEANLAHGTAFETVDREWAAAGRDRPRTTVAHMLGEAMPAASALAVLETARLDAARRLAHLSREERRRLAHALTALPLPVIDSRGYNYAEATAGGVSLDEVDPATLMSRKQRGLFFAGEMLDVDGRLGGFNFQWAWSSARTVADALSRWQR